MYDVFHKCGNGYVFGFCVCFLLVLQWLWPVRVRECKVFIHLVRSAKPPRSGCKAVTVWQSNKVCTVVVVKKNAALRQVFLQLKIPVIVDIQGFQRDKGTC